MAPTTHSRHRGVSSSSPSRAGLLCCVLFLLTLCAVVSHLQFDPSFNGDGYENAAEEGLLRPGPNVASIRDLVAVERDTEETARTSLSVEAERDNDVATEYPAERALDVDCGGLNTIWKDSDLLPFAREYIEKYVLLTVVVSESRLATHYDRARCTWLSHVPQSSLLVFTDNVTAGKDEPGTWSEGRKLSEVNAEMVKSVMNITNQTKSWVGEQLLFYSALEATVAKGKDDNALQSEWRWVVVVSDGTFVNLNEMVVMLHTYDLKGLFYGVIPEWQKSIEQMGFRWLNRCMNRHKNHTLMDTTVCACAAVPQGMGALLETAQHIFPHVKLLDNLLSLVSRSGMIAEAPLWAWEGLVGPNVTAAEVDVPECGDLWESSVALLNYHPIRTSFMPRAYVSRKENVGIGHFFNRAALPYVDKHLRRVVASELRLKGTNVEQSLRKKYHPVAVDIHNDDQHCTEVRSVRARYQCSKRQNVPLIEKGLMVTMNLALTLTKPEPVAMQSLTYLYQALYQYNRTAAALYVGKKARRKVTSESNPPDVFS